MTRVFFEITEHYSAQKMFNLVNDINSYPIFVPNCTQAGILEQQQNQIKAFIEVEKLGFKKKFVTLNTLNLNSSIEMKLVDGPFQHLIGKWQFNELSETSCKITFDLTFEFKNRFLTLTFTPLFKEIMENMVKAFTSRAKQIYS